LRLEQNHEPSELTVSEDSKDVYSIRLIIRFIVQGSCNEAGGYFFRCPSPY
jgi:hypothetical protein